jgi:pimeloyl-ACP methyl ester carboxylesterase
MREDAMTHAAVRIAAACLSAALLSGPVAAMAAPMARPAPAGDAGSRVPGYPDVVAEYIQVPGGKAPGTPTALNTASFLRLRASADGDRPRPANAVIVGLPGFSSTPPHWLFLSSQMVSGAAKQSCDGQPCRMEVWVLQRRGANLAETEALTEARRKGDPQIALNHYLGANAIGPDGKVGPATAAAAWKPLTQADLAFMADWGFEAYAADVDAMIGRIRERSGARNIFLAGHSQGGGFVSNYAARRGPGGKRGVEGLAGLIFLDGGPSAGVQPEPTAAELDAYLARVNALRSGKDRVYTDANGILGAIAGPASAASQSVTGVYYALSDPNAEAIFPLRVAGMAPAPGDDFLKTTRMTWLARAGASFDTDPVPGGGVQMQILQFLGQGLGRLDFTPMPGTSDRCDRTPPAAAAGPLRAMGPPPKCVPSGAMVDPSRVHGWIEPGPEGPKEAGRAGLWLNAQAFAPTRSNIRPVTVKFAQSGRRVIDASDMIGSNWYPSERWDFDAGFVGRYRTLKIDRDGVKLDVDKAAIAAVPVYVARQGFTQGVTGNPFPGVKDYTEVNKTGTWQTPEAKAISPLDPAINVAIYFHTDFVGADDSRAGQARPGEPGASAISGTLVDWVLKRAKGLSDTPTPAALGVRARY